MGNWPEVFILYMYWFNSKHEFMLHNSKASESLGISNVNLRSMFYLIY